MTVFLAEIVHIPIFRQLLKDRPASELQELLQRCSKLHYPASKIIYRKGDLASSVFVIEEGVVEFFAGEDKVQQDNEIGLAEAVFEAGAGELFGHHTTEKKTGKRSLTARTQVASTILRIPMDIYKSIEYSHPVDTAISMPLCEFLPSSERNEFMKTANTRKYRYNEAAYRIRQSPNELFFIVSGEFRKVDKGGLAVSYLEVGCTFGHEDIAERRSRKYSLICSSSQSIVYVFPSQAFEQHFLSNPSVMKSLRSAELLHQEILLSLTGRACNLSRQDSRTHRVNIYDNKSPQKYVENNFFAKAKQDQKYMTQFANCKKRIPKDTLAPPKPWFMSTTKRLAARLHRFQRMSTLAKTRPKQEHCSTGFSRLHRLYAKCRTEADEKIRVAGLEPAIGS